MKDETWHDNDDFWGTMAPMLFTEQHWKAAPEDAEQIINLLQPPPGAAVLDLCCGPGRHSLELAQRGFRVTGVDRTTAYLEIARVRAEQAGLKVEFVEEDMRRFCRPGAFDLALMMYTSFGYFEAPAENQTVLDNIHKSLKPGGALLIDLMGKEVLARIFQERVWSEEGGILFLQEHKVSQNWSWMQNRWILIRGSERFEFAVSHWLYSAAELVEMLEASGFSQVQVFGNLEGSDYDHTARRLVAVARK
ncbi:MAG: class I SAM-dependent methyltransferase [Chloroflexota bacterium]